MEHSYWPSRAVGGICKHKISCNTLTLCCSLSSLRALFVALNDEDVKVRGLAIDVAGRLSVKNPAYVMPQLRRHLMQLLNDMDHSPDSLQREGAR
jgi:FKBP12-rapamycin complex-associated protein